jgi:hypothetical protein
MGFSGGKTTDLLQIIDNIYHIVSISFSMDGVSESVIIVQRQMTSFSAISCMAKTSYFQWNDDDVRFVLNQHAELDFHCPSSLKQHVQKEKIHVILNE